MASRSKDTEEVHLRFFTAQDKENLAFVRKLAKKEKSSVAEVIRNFIHFQVKYFK